MAVPGHDSQSERWEERQQRLPGGPGVVHKYDLTDHVHQVAEYGKKTEHRQRSEAHLEDLNKRSPVALVVRSVYREQQGDVEDDR